VSNSYNSRPNSSFMHDSELNQHRRTFGLPEAHAFERKPERPKPVLTTHEYHALLRILEVQTANSFSWFVPAKGNTSTVALHRRGFLMKAWCVRPSGFAVNSEEQTPVQAKLERRFGYRVSPAGQQALDAYDGPKHFNQGEAWIERQ